MNKLVFYVFENDLETRRSKSFAILIVQSVLVLTRFFFFFSLSRFHPQTVFLGHPGPDDSVTIILQDIDHEDVECVLEFVYTGAAVVPGHRMDGFVTAAGALGIGPLLDPRRHLAVSASGPPPVPVSQMGGQPAFQHPRPWPKPTRHPRTTGILTPSPWAQNSRPPCAAPKHSTPRTDSATTVCLAAKVREKSFSVPELALCKRQIYVSPKNICTVIRPHTIYYLQRPTTVINICISTVKN